MPNRETRLSDNTSSAGDNATRSDSAAEKRRKLLSPYCNDGYTKGRLERRIQKALEMPSTSESSAERPADRGVEIAARLKKRGLQDPTMIKGLKGGTPEEADAYYRSLAQWQKDELNKANEDDRYASTQGYHYLQQYTDLYNNSHAPDTSAQVGLEHNQQPRTDAVPSSQREAVELTNVEKHTILKDLISISQYIYEAKTYRYEGYDKNSHFIKNYEIIASYKRAAREKPNRNIKEVFEAYERIREHYYGDLYNDWEDRGCKKMGF
jgi:hypothetical protein